MDAAIIDQPNSELLSSLEGRVCEEVIELDMFRNAEKIIIQEKSQRFGGTCNTRFAWSKTSNLAFRYHKFDTRQRLVYKC